MNVVSIDAARARHHLWEIPDPEADVFDAVEALLLPDRTQDHLHECLATLPAVERQVIRLSFGFDGLPLTVRQIEQRLGISKSSVSRIRHRALQRMRDTWPNELVAA